MGFEMWVRWKRHCCPSPLPETPLSSSLSFASFVSPLSLSHGLVWAREEPLPSSSFLSHGLTISSRPSLSQGVVWAETAPSFSSFSFLSFSSLLLQLSLTVSLSPLLFSLSIYISLSMALCEEVGSVALSPLSK
jgi:hypothetical protein